VAVIDASDVSAELQRIASSSDPADDLVRGLRRLRGEPVELGQLVDLLDHREPAVSTAALKLLKAALEARVTELADMTREQPAVRAAGVAGAERLLAAAAEADAGAVRNAVAALAARCLQPTAAEAIRRSAELDALRGSWGPDPRRLQDWPNWRRATWRNVIRWVEARLAKSSRILWCNARRMMDLLLS